MALQIAILAETVYDAGMFLREQDEEFKKNIDIWYDTFSNEYRLFGNHTAETKLLGHRFDQVIIVGWHVDYRMINIIKYTLNNSCVGDEFSVQYVG